MNQAERLMELRRLYGQLVPQQLLRSSAIVNLRQRSVVIFAENNAVAAKLKLLSPRLVNDFSERGVEVTGIRIEVQPSPARPSTPPRTRRRLGASSLGELKQLAANLPEGELKHAIAAFAEREESDRAGDTADSSPAER